jgi:isochorismate synthase
MISSEEFFKELRFQLEKGLPFVAYRKPVIPNSPGVIKAFLQNDLELYRTTDYLESGFVFAPFDEKETAILIPGKFADYLETTFNNSETSKLSKIADPGNSENALEKEKHIKLVQKGIDSIKNKSFKKVVLSRKEVIQIPSSTKPEPIEIFRDLTEKYPEAFAYIWFHPKVGLWLGATPETLLGLERNRFKTMSLAGTQKYEGTLDVNWGEKEKVEQQLVTDSILEYLKPISEKIEITPAYTAKAGGLLHLRTDISGTDAEFRVSTDAESHISGTDAEFRVSTHMDAGNMKRLIMALHPTPAVCGLPKAPAKKFILENENYNREFYTGFLGELNFKKTLQRSSNRKNRENQAYASITKTSALFVNLRCMKLEDNKAVLFVGGGITKDSNPVAEWEETSNKAQTMKSVLFK